MDAGHDFLAEELEVAHEDYIERFASRDWTVFIQTPEYARYAAAADATREREELALLREMIASDPSAKRRAETLLDLTRAARAFQIAGETAPADLLWDQYARTVAAHPSSCFPLEPETTLDGYGQRRNSRGDIVRDDPSGRERAVRCLALVEAQKIRDERRVLRDLVGLCGSNVSSRPPPP